MTSAGNYTTVPVMPRVVVWVVLAICGFTLLLGFHHQFDISRTILVITPVWMNGVRLSLDLIYPFSLTDFFWHIIFQWSAFCVAIFTVFLAVKYYSMTKNIAAFVISIAFLFSACSDLFFTFENDLWIGLPAYRNSLFLEWPISRLVYALILIGGIKLIDLKGDKIVRPPGILYALTLSLILGIINGGIFYFSDFLNVLPRFFYPENIIKQPLDLISLGLFIFAGLSIYPRYYKKKPSFLSHAIWISVIPEITTQIHMCFGVRTVFGYHFHLGLFTKVIAYFVPFIGLSLDYIQTYRQKVSALLQLQKEMREKEEAENQLRKLSRAIEQSPNVVVITDTDGNIEYVNPKFVFLTGYSVEEVMGKNPRILKSGEMSDMEYRKMWESLKRGEEWRGEFHNKKKNGELYWEKANISPIKNTNGISTHFVAIKEDITDLKETQRQLVKTKEEAENANLAKSQFLANMSHELRTPLNSVIGFANLLLKNKAHNLKESDLSFLLRIRENGMHLLNLINDILDISKIEAGKMELELSVISIGDLIKETCQQMEGRLLEKKEICLILELPENIASFKSDGDKLKQVLINLLGNAVKFTDKGSITVRVRINEKTRLPVQLDVKDTGQGIPQDRLQTIFEAFHQGDNTTRRKYGGTGLGLTITKSLLELLGYELKVESQVGQGSTFSIIFK